MKVDVIVIGSGQAGIPLAQRLAATGREVLLVERAEVGGTCVNSGCTPTKTMIASARAAHVARTAPRLGVHTRDVKVDLPAVVARKDARVLHQRDGIEGALAAAGPNLRVMRGHARFVGEREIEMDGARARADIVVVNVGARPAVPRISGLGEVGWLDNRSIMNLTSAPEHLIVLGGGYVGCELGQAFRRFGARVTIVDHNPHLLAREDDDISSELEDALRTEGIELALGVPVTAASDAGGAVVLRRADGSHVRGTHLLVATGRRPNTDDLGCEAAGIELDERGFIRVNDRYQTSASSVYAVGDVTGGPMFTHSAWDDHRLLVDQLLGHATRGRSSRIVPYAVFTDPQVARVGLSERAAREKVIPFAVARMPFREIARAVDVDETAGTMKVLVDPRTDRILGASIVGAEAAELIHVFVALMHAGASARHLVEMEFIHPTFAEGLQSLLLTLPRYALS